KPRIWTVWAESIWNWWRRQRLWMHRSESGVHRDQPGDTEPGSGAVLQQTGYGGAVDQGRQAGGEDDAALLPSVPLEPSAAGAEPAGLQPGEFVSAGVAPRNRNLVAHEPAA